MTTQVEEREYPADVQAALDRVYEASYVTTPWHLWGDVEQVSALQAALAIALAHLKPEATAPDPIVMLVEAGSTTTTKQKWWVEDSPMIDVTFEDDRIIVACPKCSDIGTWSYFEDGTEYRKFYTEELCISEDSEDFQGNGEFGLLCGSCSTRCAIPDWLYAAGCWSWDASEWGGAAE